MTVTTTELTETCSGKCAMFTCDKVEAFVSRSDVTGWRVIVNNAHHKAWRGMGKGFETHAEAVAAYKSGAMKAILNAALDVL